MTPDTTVLAVLATTLASGGGFVAWLLRRQSEDSRTLLRDVLATNRALRKALSSMGQKMAHHFADDALTADMIEDIHRHVFGGKRTSEYRIEREKIRAAMLARGDASGTIQTEGGTTVESGDTE